jgi:hypothetical protein
LEYPMTDQLDSISRRIATVDLTGLLAKATP